MRALKYEIKVCDLLSEDIKKWRIIKEIYIPSENIVFNSDGCIFECDNKRCFYSYVIHEINIDSNLIRELQKIVKIQNIYKIHKKNFNSNVEHLFE